MLSSRLRPLRMSHAIAMTTPKTVVVMSRRLCAAARFASQWAHSSWCVPPTETHTHTHKQLECCALTMAWSLTSAISRTERGWPLLQRNYRNPYTLALWAVSLRAHMLCASVVVAIVQLCRLVCRLPHSTTYYYHTFCVSAARSSRASANDRQFW